MSVRFRIETTPNKPQLQTCYLSLMLSIET